MMFIAATLLSLMAPDNLDTTLKPNDLEFDMSSYLYHWDRSEKYVEGFDNGYLGIQRSTDQANLYVKAGVFTNSYGNFGAVAGGGLYIDDTGRYKQGIEGGLTYGYKRGEGSPVFIGYAGRFDVGKHLKLKTHINPMFASFNMSFNF